MGEKEEGDRDVVLRYIYLAARAVLLARTASASCSSTSTVISQLIQASVMLTPLANPEGPSGGTFWFPS